MIRRRLAAALCRVLGHRIDSQPYHVLAIACTRCPAWWSNRPERDQ